MRIIKCQSVNTIQWWNGLISVIIDDMDLYESSESILRDELVGDEILFVQELESILAIGCEKGITTYSLTSSTYKIEIQAQHIRHDPCIDILLEDGELAVDGIVYYKFLNEFGDPNGMKYEEFLEKYSIIAL